MNLSLHWPKRAVLPGCLLLWAATGHAQTRIAQTRIAHPQPGVTEIADDKGNWGGMSQGTSHQNAATYWTEKRIEIPEDALHGVQQARLRVFMALQDYSFATPSLKPNGLDESFELLVNGKAHRYRDDDPSFSSRVNPRDPLTWAWHDFNIPVSELKTGANTFLFRKTASDKNDDYLYIGIDNSVRFGHSRMSGDGGKNWAKESLNAVGATGEYMVRLLLLSASPAATFDWKPGQTLGEDQLLGYAGLEEENGQRVLRLEFDTTKYDPQQPLQILLTAASAHQITATDERKKAVPHKSSFADKRQTLSIAPRQHPLALLTVPLGDNAIGDNAIGGVQVRYQKPVGESANAVTAPVDMAPRTTAPRGQALARRPQARLTDDGFTLQNGALAATFQTKPALRLTSLRNEYLQKNILAHPEFTHLFLVEKDEKRYGAEDWEVRRVRALSPQQIRVDLALPGQQLAAQWTVSISAQGLTFNLETTNTSARRQSWKTAFPQLGGLQLSADDYYLFPYYEGLIANRNTALRTYYGGDSAWWQMVDLFSPAGGAGVALRCLDRTGLYKGVAFQKGETRIDRPKFEPQISSDWMAPELGWESTLPPARGAAMAFEYLAHSRAAGKSYAPPPATLEMHAGDWRAAMLTYSDWAHTVWQWRPSPNKLDDVWQISSLGWRPDSRVQPAMIDKTGWRADHFKGQVQAAELMAWWEWSKKGPWKVPLDEIAARLGENFYKRYQYAFTAIDPVNGETGYMFNRGDYDYHQSWGGQAGLRKYVELLHQNGQLATLYTDPLLVDDNTELAKRAPQYAVKNPFWKDIYKVPLNPPGYVAAYGSWSMCVDTAWYQQFVVEQMARIVRDTKVDGIRFDEFGIARRPGACFNLAHQHIFAEPEHNQTLQAEALLCRKVHAAIDKFHPGFVLTAEFTGYDHLAANLEGALNYTIFSKNDEALRPVPVSLFRFYFPEHKLYVLDYASGEQGQKFAFWNAMGAFELFYPPAYARVLEENGDAFSHRNITPLAPTLLPRLYANEFRTEDKTVTLLYNARQFTVDRPVLKAPVDAKYHHFDLLNNREIDARNGEISLLMHPGDVAAVARLPRVLTVRGTSVTLARLPAQAALGQAALVLCDKDGNELWRQAVRSTQTLLPASLPPDATTIKLMSKNFLVDARSL